MNSRSNEQVSYDPIAEITFAGLHWIEASAGSGKTYTLSSLMVRILLEKYLPRQVIATTFTRAAAAELKSRIRARLIDSYRFFNARRSATEAQNIQEAQQLQNKDPLQAILLQQFSSRVGYACERLKLVIDQLDELFVGTLDSFSQKLLREFAFESGRIERAEITDQAKTYTKQLLHDILREWIQHQPQQCIDYLLMQQQLKNVDVYMDMVQSSLNFASAHMQAPNGQQIDIAYFETQLQQLLALPLHQIPQLAEYYDEHGAYHAVIAKKWRTDGLMKTTLCEDLPQLIAALQQHGAYVLFSKNYANILKNLQDLSCKKAINKCAEAVKDGFEQHPIVQQLRQFFQTQQQFNQDLQTLEEQLRFYLCQQVRIRLPQRLQQAGETTFSQQIRTLAEALQGEQGQFFARFVHRQYPLILVDEFQDTNQDQDDMLATIWRDPRRYMQGCMIMVGDRKQAIYGFRGGDMLTFVQAYHDVRKKSGKFYQLKYNHRSVKPLVEVVDALFQTQPDFGEQVHYFPVFAGQRPHPALMDDGQENPTPLRWWQLPDKQQQPQQVAWKIRELLNQGNTGQLFFAISQGKQGVIADDIAVLSKNHAGLDKVQFELERLGIRVNRPAKRSVFDHPLAQDVAAVLTAILHPYDEAKLRRALLSRLFALTAEQLLQKQLQPEGFSEYIEALSDIRTLWFERNFLTAWQALLQRFHLWQRLVASQSRDNERVVVNLRHLTELLSQHSRHYAGPQHLYQWYVKQLHQPSDRDWELERPLSDAAGVTLMTIHQSKGLEFKIVFLLNADGKFVETQKTLNFSTLEQFNSETQQPELKRVIAIQDKSRLDPNAIAQHQQRAEAEQHRLWYVALTRASYRVYAIWGDDQQQSHDGLGFWKNQAQGFEHRYAGYEAAMLQCPVAIQAQHTPVPLPMVAEPIPQKRFYPRSQTSFTALAQHLSRAQVQDLLAEHVDEYQPSADEDVQPIALNTSPLSLAELQNSADMTTMVTPLALSWIQQKFPQGPQAGTFLHHLFEQIHFHDETEWSNAVARRFKNEGKMLLQQLLPVEFQDISPFISKNPQVTAEYENIITLMTQWLHQVVHTALHDGVTLADLKPTQILAEFPFYMAMSDRVFATQRLEKLFAEYGKVMPNLNNAESARFLSGAIDLVYQHGQRFYIADYKSNYLGEHQQDYYVDALAQNMTTSSYWLQAGIYLVALHRYLKIRLKDYDIHQHLGGASYLYLRGMNGVADYGVIHWQPPTEFILRLDAIFGQSTHYNAMLN
ncbi:MAG: UvrD-helicase domain-containing protein [Acinetobacter sp.]